MIAVVFYFCFCTYYDSSASGFKGVADSLKSEYFTSGREVGGLYVFHQAFHIEVGIVDKRNRSV